MQRESGYWIDSVVETAMRQLLRSDGSLTESLLLVTQYLQWAADKAYDRGRLDAMMSLLTTEEVAEMLGVDHSTVVRRAQRKGVGWKIARDFVFTPEDVEKLRLVG